MIGWIRHFWWQVVALFLTASLIASSVCLINNENRIRELTNTIERQKDAIARLNEEHQYLQAEQSRVTFAANVAESAREIGLIDARNERLVMLPSKRLPTGGAK